MAQAYRRLASGRAALVDLDELRWKASRASALGIDPNPERDRLDRGRLTAHRGSPFGREAPDPAAERPQGHRLPEARKALHPDPRSANDPDPAAVRAGIEQVRVGDVLQPARDGVEANPAVAARIRDTWKLLALEDAALPRLADELGEGRVGHA